mmetsp:Transcript_35199/g.80314  ORF Transcript_35199/g.80314 Transcript_35199/m.80314 type:complete len:540 (-) Transcript_35199:97-1716(-)|eukprot:CAMPEP_0114558994 /NCGR_PEP_ID=MMETSP0114-20121206/10688_1 /TAXON_ID=31324 /ORGANISM="Goniomonas sp, Strain m" /LENGTH=539 /DNA_ID=CAMNT_0001744441 /DNA_START=78 /DNA_END=1697 /DNA_ORIENTATION=-
MVDMTMQAIKQICKDLQLYSTPHLNDKLYLHYKGWSSISPVIGEYSGLKSLWLEGNGFSKIENLDKLKELRCLFMNNNLIDEIEGLEGCPDLDTLNLSNNSIKSISGLGCLNRLSTLHLANNRLVTADDVKLLVECPSISCLDLSNNKLEDPEIVEILESMPNLRVLQLNGNPVVRKITSYRKTIVSRLKNLQYLDDRPVFEDERRCTNAWAVGGAEAEKAERAAIKQEKIDKDERNRLAFIKMLEDARAKRKETEEKEKGPSEAKAEAAVRREPKEPLSSEIANSEDWEYDFEEEKWVNKTSGEEADLSEVPDLEDAPTDEVSSAPQVQQLLQEVMERKQDPKAESEPSIAQVQPPEAPPTSRYATDDIFGEPEPWEGKDAPAPGLPQGLNLSEEQLKNLESKIPELLAQLPKEMLKEIPQEMMDALPDDLRSSLLAGAPPAPDKEQPKPAESPSLSSLPSAKPEVVSESASASIPPVRKNTSMMITEVTSDDREEVEEEEDNSPAGVQGKVALQLLQEDLSRLELEQIDCTDMDELD